MMRPVLLAFTAVVIAFLVSPIVVLLAASLTSGARPDGYSGFLTDARWMDATLNSFVVGGLSTVLATAIGTLAAIGLRLGRFRARTRALAYTAIATPLVVPFVVTGTAMDVAFAAAGLAHTFTGLVLAHTMIAVPLVVLTVAASLHDVDPILVRAAISLGAPLPFVMRRVLAPLIWPGIAAGALFAFAISFGEVIVTTLIAGPAQVTLPRQLLAGLSASPAPAIYVAAVILTAVSLLLLALVARVRGRIPEA